MKNVPLWQAIEHGCAKLDRPHEHQLVEAVSHAAQAPHLIVQERLALVKRDDRDLRDHDRRLGKPRAGVLEHRDLAALNVDLQKIEFRHLPDIVQTPRLHRHRLQDRHAMGEAL
jgi:hypothetical protein